MLSNYVQKQKVERAEGKEGGKEGGGERERE